jgi:uncharacterized ferritin-like protein (DUF455 family)/bacterioferritin (cytochrome b1)
METNPSQAAPLRQYAATSGYRGLDIATSANLLRRYATIERGLMRMLAGWFIAAPAYEMKYAFGHHLWDHAEHHDWIRARLTEMRGGLVRASAEPALAHCLEETAHATSAHSFVAAAYLELEAALLDCYRNHLAAADPTANAAEIRLLGRMIPDLERHLAWAQQQITDVADPHRRLIHKLLQAAGGISGLEQRSSFEGKTAPTSPSRFVRPGTIVLDSRIQRGEFRSYEQREAANAHESTVEDFKVFFNELYAAALLASVLYDADPAEVPWEFFKDLAKQFWDEVRHSEFGAVRLRELGVEPDLCNPVLFERTQDMSILHRVCYLTLGLETYFMPRKAPRVKKFLEGGDPRSQLFADQDWSDEITHVRNGTKWTEHLLENDLRTKDDVLAEVRKHIESVSGEKQEKIAAPF